MLFLTLLFQTIIGDNITDKTSKKTSNDHRQMSRLSKSKGTRFHGASEHNHAISLIYKLLEISCVADTVYLCCNYHMKKTCTTSTPTDSIPLVYTIQSRAARCKVLSRGEMSGRGKMSRWSTFQPIEAVRPFSSASYHGLAHALLSFSAWNPRARLRIYGTAPFAWRPGPAPVGKPSNLTRGIRSPREHP